MRNALPTPTMATGRAGRGVCVGLLLLGCLWSEGCASFTNPVADGIPINRLPPEVLGKRKDDERTIPLTLLRQKPPDAYHVGPGDVLGVFIGGVLGDEKQPPPVQFSEQGNLPPSIGFPIPVRDNGTLPLPLIDPLKVKGLTIAETQALIIKTYTEDKKILIKGQERVIVTLIRPRTYSVLVVRQDSGGITVGGGPGSPAGGQAGVLGQTKRGTGYVINLPAYENDVLNALAKTGGLPGLDAQNEVIIQRGYFPDFNDREGVLKHVERGPDGVSALSGTQNIRIPLRLRPGEEPPFNAEDVVLRQGDIVFIEARDTELFYTGGLLPPRQIILPRDYDLDVVQAIALVAGPLLNGDQSLNQLSGNAVNSGIGFPNPSLVTVLRRTANGGQIPIRIDLNLAMRDPRERILIQAGDFIILQETLDESFGRYLTEKFTFNLLNTFINNGHFLGTNNINVP